MVAHRPSGTIISDQVKQRSQTEARPLLSTRVSRFELPQFAQSKIDITVNELKEEREAVRKLGLV